MLQFFAVILRGKNYEFLGKREFFSEKSSKSANPIIPKKGRMCQLGVICTSIYLSKPLNKYRKHCREISKCLLKGTFVV